MTMRTAHQWSDAAGSLCRCVASSLHAYAASSAAQDPFHSCSTYEPAPSSPSSPARPDKRRKLQHTAAPSVLSSAWLTLSSAAKSSSLTDPQLADTELIWVQLADACNVAALPDRLRPATEEPWSERLAAAAAESDTRLGNSGGSSSGSAACALPCLQAALECLLRAASLMQVTAACELLLSSELKLVALEFAFCP